MKNFMAFFLQLISLRRRVPKEASSSSFVVIESKDIEKKIDGGLPISPSHDGERCCVCLSRLAEGDETRMLPCLHTFHRTCVDRWLNLSQKTCPLCRYSVEGESSNKKEELTEEMVIWFSSFHVAGF